MKRNASILLYLLCGMLCGNEFHVAIDGNDADSGCADAPFRTLKYAFSQLKPGDVCIVHPGRYCEHLDQLPSGEADKPIVIRSERPHEAVLTALAPVKNWQHVKGDLWKAAVTRTLPGRNWVFINGKPGFRARWPKRESVDFLNWHGAAYQPDASDAEKLVCRDLPDRPDHYWKNATLWVLGGARWTSWSVTVDDYDAAQKAITFHLDDKQESRCAAIPYHAPNAPQGGFFYLLGGVGEIDQPGEYFVDDATQTLYLQLAPGETPDALDIAMQVGKDIVNTRDLAVHDLQIVGFKTLGGSLVLPKCQRVKLENMRCFYLGYIDGGNTGYALKSDVGVLLGGRDSMICDSEIAYSYGSGVVVSGEDHAIVNCDIHDTGFHASYECPVKLTPDSARILVSHNSIHDTSRDCIQPNGSAHILQYNDIYRMGHLCRDLGAIYTCGADGGGTEYHHNFIHENLSSGIRMGIYLDNFTTNYFIYQNVVWDCGISGINLNRPSQNNFVINNTVIGTCKIWGRWPTDWMYNCAYVNNATDHALMKHPQLAAWGNIEDIPTETLAALKFTSIPEGVGKGFPLPGITGKVAFVGAYAPGDTWQAGHDFSRHLRPVYRQWQTPLRSLIRRGNAPGVAPWFAVGTKKIDVQRGKGGIDVCYATRNSILNQSCALIGQNAGVAQTLTGFQRGQLYEFSVWYRLAKESSASNLKLAVVENEGEFLADAEFRADGKWRQATLRVTVKDATQTLTVQLVNQGEGTIWVDDAAFVGIVPGLEPKFPGLVVPSQREKSDSAEDRERKGQSH